MATGKALNGKPYAGNPHVRFDEGEIASAAMPRRGSLLYATGELHLENLFCKTRTAVYAAVSLVMTVGAQIPLATNEFSFAFWPMTDEPVGATFTDENHSESAYTHQPNLQSATIRGDVYYHLRKICFRTYGDGYVVITDDVPGKYLFANATDKMPMCEAYRSFRCVNHTDAYPAKANPMAWLNNFCQEMRNRPAWTLEYFVKNVSAKGVLSYFDISGNNGEYRLTLSLPNSSANVNRASISAKLSGDTKSSTYIDFPAATDFSADAKWHHIALSYCQTQEQIDNGEDGDLQLYVDYQPAPSTIKVRRDTSLTPGEARIRSSVGDGYIAAPRFTTKALTADELMRASDEITQGDSNCVAYYPFDEQPQGVLIEALDSANYTSNDKLYTNQVVSGYSVSGKRVTLMAKADPGHGGVAFVSTNVVPARYIYPNLSATIPLREPNTSLFVTDGTVGNSGTDSGLYSTLINITGISKLLNCELADWTMEWFFKFEKDPGSTMMYCRLYSVNNGSQFSCTRNMNHGTNELRIETSNPRGSQTVAYPDLTSLADDKWHHFAIVCRSDKLNLFCDYIRMTESDLPVTRDAAVADIDETRFFQSCQRGMLSNLRVTGKALEPSEFLYASDSATGVLGTSGYLWSFDGTKNSAVESVPATMSTLPTDDDQYIFSDAKGFSGSVSGAGTATYADEIFPGHRLFGVTDGGRNLSSVALSGTYIKGSPLCQLGRVFTVEACVNATLPGTGAAVVLGAETASGTSAWRTFLCSDGALKIEITLSTGAVVEKTIAASGFAGTSHHLAVTADLTARLFKVYVDRALALTVDDLSLYMPLVDGSTLVVGGGCGSSTLSGKIDEVRVSREILANDDFENFVVRGVVITLQ